MDHISGVNQCMYAVLKRVKWVKITEQLRMSMERQPNISSAGGVGEGLSSTTTGVSMVHRLDTNASL